VIHQPSYSLLNRWVEHDLLDVLDQEGIGCIAFSPLAQGLLTTKYLNGIPDSSRAVQGGSFSKSMLSERNLAAVRALNEIAKQRGQGLAQMAIAWVLSKPAITSALVGASSWPQIEECLGALRNGSFHQEELEKFDERARDGELNIWLHRVNPAEPTFRKDRNGSESIRLASERRSAAAPDDRLN
jgi:L-glyceraldehyde 3-phosphate reductase